MKEREQVLLTLDLPLDLILKCYAICIEKRITFEQFVQQAVKEQLDKLGSRKPRR